jgi:hypothetical protein
MGESNLATYKMSANDSVVVIDENR